MIIPAGPVSDTNAPMSSKDRLKAEMRTKHQLRAQMAPPVRPVAAPSPPVSVAALMTSKMTPPPPSDKKPSAKKTPASGEFVNYEMTDSEYDSDDDDRSETSKPAKRIPDWARSHNLLKALERQYSPNYPIDPDELFGEVESCNLEAIFGKKSSKYRRRNSSGDWTKDKVTSEEKRKYKLALL